jgi:hypothetical protein
MENWLRIPNMIDRRATLPKPLSLSAIYHPAFVVCLIVLVINDHVLKAAIPSWLTGKLSDFAGLFVFAVLTASILRTWVTTERRLVIHHLTVSLAFVVWKIGPIEGILASTNRLTSPWIIGRTVDVTDLLALSVLLFSHKLLQSALSERASPSFISTFSRLKTALIMVIASLATVATSMPRVYQIAEERSLGTGQYSEAELLYKAESIMIHAGFRIDRRWLLASNSYRYEVVLDTNILIPRSDGSVKSDHLTLSGIVAFGSVDEVTGQRTLWVDFRSNQRVLFASRSKSLETIDTLVANILVKPLTQELSK